MKKNIAIVLFNIGGPTKPEEIKSYLMNFFSDKFIIRLPYLFRKTLAFIISRTRCAKSTKIYNSIGGSSPILNNTKAQANALEKNLNNLSDEYSYYVHISMRYWHPFSEEVIKTIISNDIYDQIILLPLYPQCSSTTTVSAYENWIAKFNKLTKNSEKFFKKTKLICNHYNQEKFIESYYQLILEQTQEAKKISELKQLRYKLFFSAHSIPEFLVEKYGDPYKKQVISTVEKIVEKLQKNFDNNLEYIITYQSKIGKMKWLEPKTENELMNAAKNRIIPVLIPITFVSENSETLFELDIEYKNLLLNHGMNYFFRVSTVSCNQLYIDCLTELITKTINSKLQFPTKREKDMISDYDKKNCLKTDCPCIKYENIS